MRCLPLFSPLSLRLWITPVATRPALPRMTVMSIPAACGMREDGVVVDVVTNWCSGPPQRQTFTIWIEARREPGEQWVQVGRSVIDFRVPGPKGLTNRVEGGRCQPGIEYSTTWQAEGVIAEGVPYDTEPDGDWFGTTGLC